MFEALLVSVAVGFTTSKKDNFYDFALVTSNNVQRMCWEMAEYVKKVGLKEKEIWEEL
jgi:hypothetical protein